MADRLLLRAVKYDRPKDLPRWVAKRITQLIMTADGKTSSRTGYLAVPKSGGKVAWSGRWQPFRWEVTDFYQYIEHLERNGFVITTAPDKVIKAALVFATMLQIGDT